MGIASLKAYLQERAGAPPGAVRSFDLNLSHYRQALMWLRTGRLKMSLRRLDHATTASRVFEAVDLLVGKHGLEGFLDLPRYNENISLYRSFETVLNGLFENFARRILAGLPVPPLAVEYFRELLDPLMEFKPETVGLSLLFSRQIYFAALIGKYLKETGAKTVCGGATLSVMPRPGSLLTGPSFVRIGEESREIAFSRSFDRLVVGEGELGARALAQDPNADPSTVPGLVYLEKGVLKANPHGAVADLDDLPLPDFSDFPLEEYHSPVLILPYLSARGCFWGKCAFCTHQKTYFAYREETVENTVERLAELQSRYGADRFNLVDEMIHPHRFNRLSGRIVESGLKIRYSAYAKPTARFDSALLRNLNASGAAVLLWGVESGNQRILDAMGKGTLVSVMARVLEESHRTGVWNLAFVMFGFPTETADEWADTVEFLDSRKEAVDALSKSRFLLLEGSRILNHPDRYGIREVIDRPDRDPISVAFDFEADRGLSREAIGRMYEETKRRLDDFGRSPYFAEFRDHMLIYASARPAESDPARSIT